MLDVIRFLENVGRDAPAPADYAAAVEALDVTAPQRQALLARDHAALNDLLGGRASMFFGILAPEEAPMEDEPAEDQPDEVPGEPAE